MNINFGVTSCGSKDTAELILNLKEEKRIKRLLHYLLVTGQLGLTDGAFYDCINDHVECLK